MKTLKTNTEGYGYKYTDLSGIHEYLVSINASYYQYIDRVGDDDYIMTVKMVDGKELPAIRGCRVVQATLSGKSNPAQEQGSALTYARRYSLLMAFGLATEDDDAEGLTRPKAQSYQKAQTRSPRPNTAPQNGQSVGTSTSPSATGKQIETIKKILKHEFDIKNPQEYQKFIEGSGIDPESLNIPEASKLIQNLSDPVFLDNLKLKLI